jgi:mRNA-degrading endonuclease RelE of RelBE toxin-antitoxin system
VSYPVVWSIQAARARRRLRSLDPAGAARLTAAIDTLADDPRPATAAPLGGSSWYYLRLGNLRAMYYIRDTTVHIDNIGSLPPC